MRRIELIDKFKEVLSKASEKRPTLNQWIDNELAWVIYERKCMFDAVNEYRMALKKNPIDVATLVNKAENQAMGHSDYAHKFALYCAFLVEEG